MMQKTLNNLHYCDHNTLQCHGLGLLVVSCRFCGPYWDSCHMLINRIRDFLYRARIPFLLCHHQHLQALFLSKRSVSKLPLPTILQAGSSQAFKHGTETFSFRVALQNERWKQSSSNWALLLQQLMCN